MEQKYLEVPTDVISGKDLNYLSDMFDWNYGALKRTIEALNNVEDQEIVNVLEKAESLFDNNLNIVLDILGNGGANLE